MKQNFVGLTLGLTPLPLAKIEWRLMASIIDHHVGHLIHWSGSSESSGRRVCGLLSCTVQNLIKDKCTMADVCYETPQKNDSMRCIFIVLLILSPHDLNDYK